MRAGPVDEQPRSFVEEIGKGIVLLGKGEYRKKISSYMKRIREHEQKIRKELASPNPHEGRIRHWEVEIEAFRIGIKRAEKRLGRAKR